VVVGERAPARVVRLDLTYEGTEFLGWQRQAAGRTVQAVVEEALERVLGAPHKVVGAGRTDAGAHALHMVASFRTRSSMADRSLAKALDAVLPPDVGVSDATTAAPGFHARRSAAWKWYRYSLLRARGKRPLLRRTAWRVPGRLDATALRAGAAAVVGTHDFRSFSNAGSPRTSTVRTVFAAQWVDDGELLHLDVVGDGFLYRMVRSIVGTLVALARGREPADAGAAMGRILEARDRRAAGPAAPALGLCLRRVGVRGEPPWASLPARLREAVESGLPLDPGDRT
jgi:tRNA pseudouridine38-40 synthase